MAEAHKSEHKPKHKKVHKIITTRATDGSFGHEHVHEGSDKSEFAGTSQDIADLHQHMDDHFGKGAQPPEEEGAQPEGEQAAPAPGE